MAIERVCVLGAGAIGSLYAAHIDQAAEVCVLVRRAEHAAAINASWLRVSGKSELVARPLAVHDPDEVPAPDLVIVAVKATQLADAAAALAGRFAGAAVMTVQNGIGAEAAISHAGGWPLISAVTFMSGIRHADDHVEYELDTATWMGPYADTSTDPALVRETRDLILAGGLQAEAFDDLVPAQWSKLIFNAAINGVAALTGLPHVAQFGALEQPDDLGHLVRGVIDEGKAVARAASIELYEDPWEMNLRAVARGETEAAGGAYAHMPSMLEDVNARRATEVDWIGGALVREGERLGVPTPLNAALWRLIRGREASWAREHEGLAAAAR
ncbi:MAG: ketopantoate reductase family protein [Solirubrobacteraceae bacterium]